MKPFLFIVFVQAWSGVVSNNSVVCLVQNCGATPAHTVKKTRQVCADDGAVLVVDECNTVTIGGRPPKHCAERKSPPCKKWRTEEYDAPDESITDEWTGSRWTAGDSMESGQYHWKAVLLENRAALDRYLASTPVPLGGAFVFDVVARKMLKVEQREVKRTQTQTAEVFDHYEVSVKP